MTEDGGGGGYHNRRNLEEYLKTVSEPLQ